MQVDIHIQKKTMVFLWFFELGQHVSKTSLKYFFVLSLSFKRKNSMGKGDRRLKWIRLFILNSEF